MITVFIEYKLEPEKRTKGMLLLADMAARMEGMGAKQYRSWEGVDQPGLFVEAFDVETLEQYEQIKAVRLADRDFCNCVAGAGKLNVWAFRAAEL
ncbi:hypothetical protein [Brevibacillus reuszeri]|uniref:hypothetical protein n=1 Tax=Brevibacillus reuszeri TaxID=54915 RepID=UPI000CCC44CE|nr:hypothetical protein [Brevibacillus reuszeri]